jgi:hypothetical protein
MIDQDDLLTGKGSVVSTGSSQLPGMAPWLPATELQQQASGDGKASQDDPFRTIHLIAFWATRLA